MVEVGVNPNLAYDYDYTALWVHYKYVHNVLWADALMKVSPENLYLASTEMFTDKVLQFYSCDI